MEPICTICQETIARGDSFVNLSCCSQKTCTECFILWMRKSNTCPTCRHAHACVPERAGIPTALEKHDIRKETAYKFVDIAMEHDTVKQFMKENGVTKREAEISKCIGGGMIKQLLRLIESERGR